MEHSLFLAVPRMHEELAALPPGCRVLLPGLPQQAANSWMPAGLPMTGAEAAACLAAFESSVRDGARGTPVQSLYAGRLPDGLSASEMRALQEMTGGAEGMPAYQDDMPARQAQYVLLLAWLREKQALEMADLQGRIAATRHSLSSILSGRKIAGEKRPAVSEDDLSPWRQTFAAFLAFLPCMPQDTAFYICSPDMAEEILAGSPCPGADGPLRMKAAELAALCGPSAEKPLKYLHEAEQQRQIALYFPENIRRMQ